MLAVHSIVISWLGLVQLFWIVLKASRVLCFFLALNSIQRQKFQRGIRGRPGHGQQYLVREMSRQAVDLVAWQQQVCWQISKTVDRMMQADGWVPYQFCWSFAATAGGSQSEMVAYCVWPNNAEVQSPYGNYVVQQCLEEMGLDVSGCQVLQHTQVARGFVRLWSQRKARHFSLCLQRAQKKFNMTLVACDMCPSPVQAIDCFPVRGVGPWFRCTQPAWNGRGKMQLCTTSVKSMGGIWHMKEEIHAVLPIWMFSEWSLKFSL